MSLLDVVGWLGWPALVGLLLIAVDLWATSVEVRAAVRRQRAIERQLPRDLQRELELEAGRDVRED